jgi:hypothetical protein
MSVLAMAMRLSIATWLYRTFPLVECDSCQRQNHRAPDAVSRPCPNGTASPSGWRITVSAGQCSRAATGGVNNPRRRIENNAAQSRSAQSEL